MNELKINAGNYPMNLLDKISERTTQTPAWDYLTPPDLAATVEYVVASLSERESRVIHMRYQCGMTYEEIGKEFSVTRERIRQLEEKALRKISHPSRLNLLINGVQGEIAKRTEKAKENAISGRLEEAVLSVMKISEYLAEITQNDIFKAAAEEFKENGFSLETPIEELYLSVRSLNCLARRGVKTLRDLTGLTLEELKETRNLGKHSYNEVVEEVHQKGLLFKDERSE